jgi:hypothetical protein
MNNYKLKVNEDKVIPTSYYLLELKIEDGYYLLCKEKSLMVWETLKGLEQSLIRAGGVFKSFAPWPIRVTTERFPSMYNLYFNPITLELTGKEYITEVSFQDIAGLAIIPVDEERTKDYRMLPR